MKITSERKKIKDRGIFWLILFPISFIFTAYTYLVGESIYDNEPLGYVEYYFLLGPVVLVLVGVICIYVASNEQIKIENKYIKIFSYLPLLYLGLPLLVVLLVY